MATNVEIPESLIQLQRTANAARREATRGNYSTEAWQPWLDAADVLQRAVTDHAAAAAVSRYELEMAVKKTAREQDETDEAVAAR
ncbi:hypothetical protein [Streptomyces sp. NPDC093109]|uniref:hypothetical protein n=1 Tax=Streptomyces sp. NPDC093109 TaxID=3154977 RepID=UPI00344CDAFC